jgi:gliding motility-associated-like protein
VPFPPSAQPSPARITFTWDTNCDHIRPQPYQVRFKATDQPPQGEGPKLADFATWFVSVVGPPPEGLAANQGNGNFVNLAWNPYQCANATSMQIWRRVDSNPFEPEHCELGMPENAGYELIDLVDISRASYRDNNNGLGLEFGATYCYRLVAVFDNLEGMESIVSDEACVQLEEIDGQFGSLTTNVSVEVTDTDNGQLFIRWTSPFDIDQGIFPPPYTYELYRGQGFTSGNYELISGGRITDTTFTDSGLNTTDQVYNYIVRVFDNNLTPIDTTLSASSVRLDPTPLAGAMELNWSARVPWSNVATNYPMHLVYRDNVDPSDPDQLVLIDSVNVLQDGLTYLDDGSATGESGLNDTQEYCYYIITRGVYGNDQVSEPLINRSQIVCAQPNDTVPPCPPLELAIANSPDCETFLLDKPCDFEDYFNELEWEDNTDPGCDDDVRSFNIYFSETGQEEDFERIANVSDNFFVHEDLSSFKGCYRITAIDRSGNESEPTEIVCNDNCPNYDLPNVFTPNNDSYNDTFQAFNIAIPDESGGNVFNCPRFVRSVDFAVYNRWGKLVYSNENEVEKSLLINWDGKTNEGRMVSTGVYFYLARVVFDVLDPSQQQQDIKGWVQVLE